MYDAVNGRKIRIGIIGTGFIARGLFDILNESSEYEVSAVRTRRNPKNCVGLDISIITNSDMEIIEKSDIVVECSGDPVYATPIVRKVLQSRIPVVTMDAELQITTGSYLQGLGDYFSEAEGDQPGCLAALKQEVVAMGFKPLVYGNIKGFLNPNPQKEEMEKWSKKQGISIGQVTSFTDGTKIAIEQVLVANGLGAEIPLGGLKGGERVYDDFNEGVLDMAKYAEEKEIILSDYIMCSNKPLLGHKKAFPGVFIMAKHNDFQRKYLEYYKMGMGPYYIFEKPYHLCHMEIIKTLNDVIEGKKPLLNNNPFPRYSVSAIAKRSFMPGDEIKRGIGSFDVRGEAIPIQNNEEHIPIGLMFNCRVKRKIESGQMIQFDDIEIPESEALRQWKNILNQVIKKC